jgi:hypothetical protein
MLGQGPIQGTGHPQGIFTGHMGIDHRGLDAHVAKQLLNGAQVGAAFEQVGGKTMPFMPSSA